MNIGGGRLILVVGLELEHCIPEISIINSFVNHGD